MVIRINTIWHCSRVITSNHVTCNQCLLCTLYISLDVNVYICQLVTQVNASHVCWQLSVKPIDICRAYRKIWGFTKIILSYLTILVSNNCNQREAPRNHFRMFGCVSPITSLLCQNEMRTRERMECQSIRTVWDISRNDRARTATCSLQTTTYIYI